MPVISTFLLFITLAISALRCVMEAASIPKRNTTPTVTKNRSHPTHGFILLFSFVLFIATFFIVFIFSLNPISIYHLHISCFLSYTLHANNRHYLFTMLCSQSGTLLFGMGTCALGVDESDRLRVCGTSLWQSQQACPPISCFSQ